MHTASNHEGALTPAHPGRLRGLDVAELVIGTLVLAFPVAVTEEVWQLSAELSGLRIAVLALSAMAFMGGFTYLRYFHLDLQDHVRAFVQRVGWSYVVTLVTCALLLISLDRLDPIGQPLVALKRTILVAFPAAFSATVVDSIR